MSPIKITNPLSHKAGRRRRKKIVISQVLCLCFILGLFCTLVTAFYAYYHFFHIEDNHQSPNQNTRKVSDIAEESDGEENYYDYGYDNTPSPTSVTKEPESTNANFNGTATLTTEAGKIVIKLRPDLSQDSIDYITSLILSPAPCTNCRFYRAEYPGILQGILVKKSVKKNKILGKCPDEYASSAKSVDKNNCPKWDPDCGCHGPIMTRGMVGWAGGGGGPDFFINMYKQPATFWENQHTVWGEVIDETSLLVIEEILDMEVQNQGGMHYLKKPLHITPSYP